MEFSSYTTINGRYQLVKKVGRGSFGEVWLAKDNLTKTDLAIKVYIALDDKGLQEFSSEYTTTYTLNHPNLLHATYYDIYENRPFLVMPFCPESSEKLIGKTDESEVWRFIRDTAAGLEFLHSKDIIHRDIKPDNILCDIQGNYLITDFGISLKMRSTLRRNSKRDNDGGDVSGTLPYMGPEMFSSCPNAVKATDIWAFGASVFEILTGELPYCGQGGVMILHGADAPVILGEWSENLKNLVTSCLSKETWERPTAEQIRKFAEGVLQGDKRPWGNVQTGNEKVSSVKDGVGRKHNGRILLIASSLLLLALASVSVIILRNKNSKDNLDILLKERVSEMPSFGLENCNLKISSDTVTVLTETSEASGPDARDVPEAADVPVVLNAPEAANVPVVLNAPEASGPGVPADALEVPQTSLPTSSNESTEVVVPATLNGHEYVDLGLSVKWATCNVGADTPEDFGDFYSWADTEVKNKYTPDNMKYCAEFKSIGNAHYTKYVLEDKYGEIDYKSELDFIDDVASVKWGGSWCIPSISDWEELLDNTTLSWVERNGHWGCLATSVKNGKSVFFPASGFIDGSKSGVNDRCFYWTSSLYPNQRFNAVYRMQFDKRVDAGEQIDWMFGPSYRWSGYVVKPIWNEKAIEYRRSKNKCNKIAAKKAAKESL